MMIRTLTATILTILFFSLTTFGQSILLEDNLTGPVANDVTENCGCEYWNARYGDFNCDGQINLLDLAIIGEHYNTVIQGGEGYLQGDTNADGKINLTDLVTFGENYNKTVPIPEPAALGLMILGCLFVVRR